MIRKDREGVGSPMHQEHSSKMQDRGRATLVSVDLKYDCQLTADQITIEIPRIFATGNRRTN
jgi:hypothetical protein